MEGFFFAGVKWRITLVISSSGIVSSSQCIIYPILHLYHFIASSYLFLTHHGGVFFIHFTSLLLSFFQLWDGAVVLATRLFFHLASLYISFLGL